MATLSLASDLAWRLAANEALARGSTTIERGDLLIGIFSIEKAFSPELVNVLRLTEYGLSTVRVEWQETLLAATKAMAGIAFIRRSIREEMPRVSQQVSDKPKVSRSDDCKAVFNRACELAERTGSTVVGVRYLLFAALDRPGLGLSSELTDRLLRIKVAISPLTQQPLHTSISKIERGYISDTPFAAIPDRQSSKH
jgi:hypothetical protein